MELGGVPIGTILVATSPWALLSLTFYLIITGRLVPRSTYTDVVKDRDAWREANTTCMEIQREQSDQMDEMLRGLQTLDTFIRSMPSPPAQALRPPHTRGR